MGQGRRMNTGIENVIEYFVVKSRDLTSVDQGKRACGLWFSVVRLGGGLRNTIHVEAGVIGFISIEGGRGERWS